MNVVTPQPMRGRARDLIVDAADRLFYHDGIRATSVDAIADEAGVTKRTLYHHFASKDALVASYLDRRDPLMRERFAAQVRHAGSDPHEAILALFDALAAWADSGDYRGCAFLNAVSECADDLAVRSAAIAHKDAVEAWFRETLGDARSGATMAPMLMVLYDGALARALVYRNGTPIRDARAAVELLLATTNEGAR